MTATDTAADAATQEMVIGTFDSHDEATRAVRRLIDAGIPAEHISIIAKRLAVREQVEGFITSSDIARTGAEYGVWTGGLVGLLAGAAFLFVPVAGPLVILGPLATTAIGAIEGGALGGLLGSILGKQVEKDRIRKIQADLEAGKYLLVVRGPREEIETARRVMNENNGHDISAYQAA